MLPNAPKCFQMLSNASKYAQMRPNASSCDTSLYLWDIFICKLSQMFPMLANTFKCYQLLPNSFILYLTYGIYSYANDRKCFEVFSNARKYVQMFRKTSKCAPMLSNASKCFQMISNASKCFQMLPHASTCFQMLPNAPKCFQMTRWHKTHNDTRHTARKCINAHKNTNIHKHIKDTHKSHKAQTCKQNQQ